MENTNVSREYQEAVIKKDESEFRFITDIDILQEQPSCTNKAKKRSANQLLVDALKWLPQHP